MAIEDVKKLKTSRRIASTWVVISMAIAVLIGVVGNGMIHAGALESIPAADSQRIIIKISTLLSNYGVLPAIVAGLILSGILPPPCPPPFPASCRSLQRHPGSAPGHL